MESKAAGFKYTIVDEKTVELTFKSDQPFSTEILTKKMKQAAEAIGLSGVDLFKKKEDVSAKT